MKRSLQLNEVPNNWVGSQTLREREHEGRDQLHNGRILRSYSKGVNAEESELKQHLHNIEQERD